MVIHYVATLPSDLIRTYEKHHIHFVNFYFMRDDNGT